MYLMMCFSDFVPEPEARDDIGLAFLGVLVLYALVHIYFLCVDSYCHIRDVCKRQCHKLKIKRMLKQR